MLRSPVIQTVLLCAGIAGVLLVLHGGQEVPSGASYRHNIPWIEGFHAAFWGGDIYPRRIGELWYGLGGLDFYFYAPAPFWLSSLIGPVLAPGGGASGALAAGGAIMIAISTGSFYAFARHFHSHVHALAGAAAYAFLPYHYLTDWFMRQAIGEVAAMAVIPLVALAAARLLETPRRGGRLLATSFALLAFCHLPSALLTAVFIAAMAVFLVLRERASPASAMARLVPFAVWGGLGAGLSALYWLPAIALLDDVSASLLFNEYATPTNWFLFDGRPEPNPVTMSVVRAQFLAASLAAFCLLVLRAQVPGRALAWCVGPLIFGAVMMTPLSAPLWAHTPLQAVQFPWRSNVIVDLGLALVLTQLLCLCTPAADKRARTPARGALLVVLIAIANTGLTALPHAGDAIRRTQGATSPTPMTGAAEYLPPAVFSAVDARINAAAIQPATSVQQYEAWFAEALALRDEALANARADSVELALLPESGQRLRLAVDMGPAGGDLRLPLPYWSHWRARLDGDGKPLALRVDDATGMSVISLPPGRQRVTLELAPTLPERLASMISLAGLLLLLASFLPRRLARRLARGGVHAAPSQGDAQ